MSTQSYFNFGQEIRKAFDEGYAAGYAAGYEAGCEAGYAEGARDAEQRQAAEAGDLISRSALLAEIDAERGRNNQSGNYSAAHLQVHSLRRLVEEAPAVNGRTGTE